eukprot:TRINITY_DN15734_c0_g1_i2.p1 TRINITY_DN15734_c0_g1~~TRINITY_DN15734_c0_g1_i2.p1  ORF type:complete len:194 (+),score=79.40 TRINITY_DN15734_c0_g1_i2:106-687(+)
MTEIKINICDGAAIKRVLDDAVVSYLVNQQQFAEQLTVSNSKLALSVASCLLAAIAQFYPAPFPDNYYVLLVCCSLYFVCSGLLQLIAMFVEQDVILFGWTPGTRPQPVQVRSRLPRYESQYTLTLTAGAWSLSAATATVLGRQPTAAPAAGPTASLCRSVGAFFDASGVFVEHRLHAELDRLITQFSTAKLD